MFAKTKEEYHRSLITFSDDEADKLKNYLIFIMHFNSGKRGKELAPYLKELKPCSPSDIYKFSTNNTFKDFCLRADFPMTRKWATYLQKKNYIGKPVISIDRKVTHSIFDQYRGAYLYSNYLELSKKGDNATALLALDMACDLGLFQALKERCDLNKEKIKNITNSVGEKDWILSLGQLLADIETMGNLYGTIGHLNNTLILLDIGNYFCKKSKREGAAALGKEFQKGAVESFFMAKLLTEKDLPENLGLIAALSKEKGLALYKFHNWTDAESFVWKKIDPALVNRDSLLASAQENVELALTAKINTPTAA